ncbi:competence protein CoiA family protein [Pseudomonas aeruginosa]|uniref:competence protein CoiA family protein n=1 Tax=Pseudomonas aeruginosa TaxID=287 RepID=UPI0034E092D7
MGCTAIVDGKRVVGAFLPDEEWRQVVKRSKLREVLMPDTRLPAVAKTVRWRGGITRFFAHFPGEAPEGYASHESPEHAAQKLAIYARLLDLGFTVELEAGMDDWRADVLVGPSAFAPALAIEVQLTRQSAQATYERTEQRFASGVPTLWLFGKNASTGHLGADLTASNPVFVARDVDHAADIAQAVCSGSAFYDDLSQFEQTPARPIGVKVACKCGVDWLRPIGVVLLPNRIRGDLKPVYVSCSVTLSKKRARKLSPSEGDDYLRRYMKVFWKAAETYSIALGEGRPAVRTRSGDKMVYRREYACPKCRMRAHTKGTIGVGTPIPGDELVRCPLPVVANVDARPALNLEPAWFVEPHAPTMESVMSNAEWKERFIDRARASMLMLAPEEGVY